MASENVGAPDDLHVEIGSLAGVQEGESGQQDVRSLAGTRLPTLMTSTGEDGSCVRRPPGRSIGSGTKATVRVGTVLERRLPVELAVGPDRQIQAAHMLDLAERELEVLAVLGGDQLRSRAVVEVDDGRRSGTGHEECDGVEVPVVDAPMEDGHVARHEVRLQMSAHESRTMELEHGRGRGDRLREDGHRLDAGNITNQSGLANDGTGDGVVRHHHPADDGNLHRTTSPEPAGSGETCTTPSRRACPETTRTLIRRLDGSTSMRRTAPGLTSNIRSTGSATVRQVGASAFTTSRAAPSGSSSNTSSAPSRSPRRTSVAPAGPVRGSARTARRTGRPGTPTRSGLTGGSESVSEIRVLEQPLHRLRQVIDAPGGDQQAVDTVGHDIEDAARRAAHQGLPVHHRLDHDQAEGLVAGR